MIGAHGFDWNAGVSAARAGIAGCRPVTRFDVSTYRCKVGFEVPAEWDAYFEERTGVRGRERRFGSRSAEFSMVAAGDAMEMAGGAVLPRDTPVYGGVSSNSADNMEVMLRRFPELLTQRVRRLPPETVVQTYFSLPATKAAEFCGLSGEAKVDSAACASVFHALQSGRRAILSGDHPAAVVVGSDAPINHMTWQVFESARMMTAADDIYTFDERSDRGTLGEGAAGFILEDEAAAEERGANVLARIAAVKVGQEPPAQRGMPDWSGRTWAEVIGAAVSDEPDIDLIVAHSPADDRYEQMEINALRAVFGEQLARIPITTQSASHGQNGACGSACKLALAVAMLQRQEIFPITNLEQPAPYAVDLHLVGSLRKLPIQRVLVTGRGFGGAMAAVVVTV